MERMQADLNVMKKPRVDRAALQGLLVMLAAKLMPLATSVAQITSSDVDAGEQRVHAAAVASENRHEEAMDAYRTRMEQYDQELDTYETASSSFSANTTMANNTYYAVCEAEAREWWTNNLTNFLQRYDQAANATLDKVEAMIAQHWPIFNFNFLDQLLQQYQVPPEQQQEWKQLPRFGPPGGPALPVMPPHPGLPRPEAPKHQFNPNDMTVRYPNKVAEVFNSCFQGCAELAKFCLEEIEQKECRRREPPAAPDMPNITDETGSQEATAPFCDPSSVCILFGVDSNRNCTIPSPRISFLVDVFDYLLSEILRAAVDSYEHGHNFLFDGLVDVDCSSFLNGELAEEVAQAQNTLCADSLLRTIGIDDEMCTFFFGDYKSVDVLDVVVRVTNQNLVVQKLYEQLRSKNNITEEKQKWEASCFRQELLNSPQSMCCGLDLSGAEKHDSVMMLERCMERCLALEEAEDTDETERCKLNLLKNHPWNVGCPFAFWTRVIGTDLVTTEAEKKRLEVLMRKSWKRRKENPLLDTDCHTDGRMTGFCEMMGLRNQM